MNEINSNEYKSLKILVSGDVEGRLNDLYNKVKNIQSKAGKFDLLICVGEFFAENEEENSEIEQFCSDSSLVPITTYIIGTNNTKRLRYFKFQDGFDLSKGKIIYLGSKGFFNTSSGLSIVYLSGIENISNNNKRLKSSQEIAKPEQDEYVRFDQDDIDKLVANWDKRNTAECVDILITNQWPKFVERLTNQTLDKNFNSETFGSELVSQLALILKPRYHFSANQNIFFERIPYRNHRVLLEKEKHATKFLALAKVNKPNKPKYLYAFNITPAKKMNYIDIIRLTSSHITDCPYNHSQNETESKKDDQIGLQFFYDAEHIKKMNNLKEEELNENKRKLEDAKEREKEPCWFCLGGAKVERQYIVSVGDKCYLSYAKGALNNNNLLIIPIDHIQSSLNADDQLLTEIEKYKMALRNYFKSKNMCVLFYERNFKTKHMQIQVFGLNSDKSYLLRNAFTATAQDQGITIDEIPMMTNLKQILNKKQFFYYLELPEDDRVVKYLSIIKGNFPLNFGRDVVASELILNVPERVDWKMCLSTVEEEKLMSTDFRKDFKNFDPSAL